MQQAEALKAKGVQELACVSVNDAFVMSAWGKEHGADGKVRVAICVAVAQRYSEIFCEDEQDANINHTFQA